MTIVTRRHCRELDYCSRGMRPWFAANGLSWADFVKHGIDAEVLRATHNAMADRVIAHAEREAYGE